MCKILQTYLIDNSEFCDNLVSIDRFKQLDNSSATNVIAFQVQQLEGFILQEPRCNRLSNDKSVE